MGDDLREQMKQWVCADKLSNCHGLSRCHDALNMTMSLQIESITPEQLAKCELKPGELKELVLRESDAFSYLPLVHL